MGFFDKLLEKKKLHDIEVKRKQDEENWKREQRRREEIQQDADAVRHLESGELVQGIVREMKSSLWLAKSQGDWDTNRRQIIITPVAVLTNNHKTDLLFRLLEGIEQNGEDGIRYYIHRDVIKGIRQIHGEWFSYEKDSEVTKRNDAELALYRESDSYMLEVYLYHEWGYAQLNDALLVRRFARALKSAMEKAYLTLRFTDIEENEFGYYKFEMAVSPSTMKTLF